MNVSDEYVRDVAASFGLSPKARRFLLKFAHEGEAAKLFDVLGVPDSELPALNEAMAAVTELSQKAVA